MNIRQIWLARKLQALFDSRRKAVKEGENKFRKHHWEGFRCIHCGTFLFEDDAGKPCPLTWKKR